MTDNSAERKPEFANTGPISSPNGAGDDEHLRQLADDQASAVDALLSEAKDQKATGDDGKGPIIVSSNPLQSAQIFTRRTYFHKRTGLYTLRYQQGVFYWWNGAGYEPADPQVIRQEVYYFLDGARKKERRTETDKDGNKAVKEQKVPVQPNSGMVSQVIDALKAVVTLRQDIEAPAWLDGSEGPPARDCVALQNGILYVPRDPDEAPKRYPPTPNFWTIGGLPFAYDPDAPEPKEWLRFLSDPNKGIWPDDPESVRTLQEVFGYYLTPDTSLQKIFMLKGPRRSGKGTISRVLTALLGSNNVTNPTLSQLATNFGLQPLIGRSAAIVTDARLSGRIDKAAISERLLSISGEDDQTIDVKYQPQWNGRLKTRFMILTNEMPHLTDASGALPSRFITLVMDRSFFGAEDTRLQDRLMAELPGILNWALEGRRRLYDRGQFVQPASGKPLRDDMEESASPVDAFLNECCTLGDGLWVPREDLYQAWCAWCRKEGRQQPGTKTSFGIQLNAARPDIRTGKRRLEGEQKRVYEGLALVRAGNPGVENADIEGLASQVVRGMNAVRSRGPGS